MSHGVVWPPEMIAKAREMRDAGLTIERIAAEMGLSRSSVSNKFSRLKLCGPRCVWTPEMDAKLRELRDQGFSAARCMPHFDGFSRNAIVSRMYRTGLTGNDRPRAQRVPKPRGEPRAPKAPRQPKPVARSLDGLKAIRGRRDKTAQFRVHDLPPPRRVRPADGEVMKDDPTGCRFIAGDPRVDPSACCKPRLLKADGVATSWCPEHYALCFQVERKAA